MQFTNQPVNKPVLSIKPSVSSVDINEMHSCSEKGSHYVTLADLK